MMIDGYDGYVKLFSFTIQEQRRSGYLKMRLERVQMFNEGQLTTTCYGDANEQPDSYIKHLHTARRDRHGGIDLINFFGDPSRIYLDEEEEMSHLCTCPHNNTNLIDDGLEYVSFLCLSDSRCRAKFFRATSHPHSYVNFF